MQYQWRHKDNLHSFRALLLFQKRVDIIWVILNNFRSLKSYKNWADRNIGATEGGIPGTGSRSSKLEAPAWKLFKLKHPENVNLIQGQGQQHTKWSSSVRICSVDCQAFLPCHLPRASLIYPQFSSKFNLWKVISLQLSVFLILKENK